MTIQKTGAKTTPRAPKLVYFDGRALQLSVRVNHGTPSAGMIGHLRVCILISDTNINYIVNNKNDNNIKDKLFNKYARIF